MRAIDEEQHAVTAAIVLAAGNGDRFASRRHQSKLLHPVLGEPLIHHTLRSAATAGITDITIVLGYQAERVRAAAQACRIDSLKIRFVYNASWQLENGVSVLTARSASLTRFALLMGDHLFEAAALRRLIRTRSNRNDLLLGVDAHPSSPDIVEEATKVRVRDGRIAEIGKHVDPYDALDTGLFVCGRSLFAALAHSCAAGDTTLSGGVRVLAALGMARAVDISGAYWHDVDTIADLESVEATLPLASHHR